MLTLGGESPPPGPWRELIVAVGPEGGFAGDEREAAVRLGWQAVALGPRTLRTETAALCAASRFSFDLP